MKVRIGAGGSRRLECAEAFDPLVGLEVIFHPEDFAARVDPLKRVRSEAVHVAEGQRDAAIAEQNRELMGGLGTQREKIPDVFGFLDIGVGIALLRVDEVGKFQWIADEKDRRIVAD